MQKKLTFIAIAALIGMAGCDEIDSDLERGMVGAAVGCIAGEVLVDGRCVEGAVIGGAGGVLIDDI